MSALLSRAAVIGVSLVVTFVVSACGRIDDAGTGREVEDDATEDQPTELERKSAAPDDTSQRGPADPELGRSTPGPSGSGAADGPRRPPE